MDSSSQSEDLARLREQFPGWTFGSAWVTAGSGPDRRRVWASRGPVFLSAWDARGLAAEVGNYTVAGRTREARRQWVPS